ARNPAEVTTLPSRKWSLAHDFRPLASSKLDSIGIEGSPTANALARLGNRRVTRQLPAKARFGRFKDGPDQPSKVVRPQPAGAHDGSRRAVARLNRTVREQPEDSDAVSDPEIPQLHQQSLLAHAIPKRASNAATDRWQSPLQASSPPIIPIAVS